MTIEPIRKMEITLFSRFVSAIEGYKTTAASSARISRWNSITLYGRPTNSTHMQLPYVTTVSPP